ncbi:MAG: nucleotidyltransferase domain-containing protein [Anaerolineae bacterium]|nr:nucleotidyltransferase domain-containing protein [Anaerolineae bacterium]
MQDLTLRTQLSMQQLVHNIADMVVAVFGDRILSVYLGGSFSRGQLTETSDLDMNVVFRGSLSDEEYEHFMTVRTALQPFSPLRLEMYPTDESKIKSRPADASTRSSICLYGEDFLPDVPALTIEAFAMRSMHKAIHYMTVLRGRPNRNPLPLDYPDATQSYYGYTQYGDFDGAQAFQPGTRIILGMLARCTTALLAIEHGIEAQTKPESIQQYRTIIDGEWGSFVQDVYDVIKTELHYELPQNVIVQKHLSQLLHRLLAFENDAIARFKPTIVASLQSDDRRQKKLALVALKNIQMNDSDILQALAAITECDDEALLNEVRAKNGV